MLALNFKLALSPYFMPVIWPMDVKLEIGENAEETIHGFIIDDVSQSFYYIISG